MTESVGAECQLQKRLQVFPSQLETLTYRSGDRIYGQVSHALLPVGEFA